MPTKWIISCLNDWLCFDYLKTKQKSYYKLPNSAFWGWLSIESQPQNAEFRINPENFHPCMSTKFVLVINFKMPTIKINDYDKWHVYSEQNNCPFCLYFYIYEIYKLQNLQSESSIEISFITSRPGHQHLYNPTPIISEGSDQHHVSLFLFDLILYLPSTIFQLNRDRSSWVEPVLS